MLSGQKILITGPNGRIAFGLAQMLAGANEVWGVSRFTDPAGRAEVEALGVTTRALDLGDGEFGDLPTDFTHLLHIAADFGNDYERALRVNGEGTGLLLAHCRDAEAALVMSTVTVYKPHPDPFHPFRGGRPAGRCRAARTPALLHRQDRRGGRGTVLRPRVRPARHDRPHGLCLR